MNYQWDGITQAETLDNHEVEIRHRLANAVRAYNWTQAFTILNKRSDLINVTRPNGKSLYAPLHQAAHGNASVEVIRQMVNLGAWRTLTNADDERPVDIARRKNHQHIVQILQPVYQTYVPHDVLQKIQHHFHTTILARAEHLVKKSSLRLPELQTLLEINPPEMWFPIPGMYGGFKYSLEGDGKEAKLISESWCRIVGGSGQLHEITGEGSILVNEGFV